MERTPTRAGGFRMLSTNRMRAIVQPLVSLSVVALVTLVLRDRLGTTNQTTIALAYLLVVLFVAAWGNLSSAVVTSVAAMLGLNYYFMPPVGTFTIVDPHNWIALVAFLVVGVVASQLATSARDRTREALERRNELSRLYGVSRDVLLITDGDSVMPGLARHIAQRFEFDTVTLYLDDGPRGWATYDGGHVERVVPPAALDSALAAARGSLQFDARTRSYAGQTAITVGEALVVLVPVRIGTTVIGLLGLAGRAVEASTLDALAGMVAIAAERAQFLAERRAAELTRQRAELASAVLASLSHDLRTPLTAIRVAVSNVRDASLEPAARDAQADLAMGQLQHLTRLFDEILDMARIQADAVQARRQWVAAADIVDAALATLAPLGSRDVRVFTDDPRLVEVDPQLTSAALTHLVENAAQYSPEGSPIDIDAVVTDEGLRIVVTDRGPGLEPQELDRLFEPLFRGARARQIAPGTGMGLAITRGLLAAENGRVWAENVGSGGARFTIQVPGRVRTTDQAGANA